ncbi:hypothetical protein [Acrocarpospora sp. B8E8]|uniref:hypothetical protein n=1 Tax=Acrocarpospora sp. B8E8 TaxID=3153572 RepID=UPI00325C72A1
MSASPASAQAAPPCVLSINPVPINTYKVQVDCGPLIPRPWDLYSDDGFLGAQFILSSSVPVIYVSPAVLNEDEGGEDEIFAKVIYRTATGAIRTVRTNTVHGNF